MIFNVEKDTGSCITGYLVPDSFAGQCTLSVWSEGREILRMPTDELRDALISGQRHETGICGFTLDEKNVPGIEKLTDLSLTDHESNVLIYRRPMASCKEFRAIRLETHLFPLWELDEALGKHFRYSYRCLERMGRETIEQIFHLNDAQSFYASGRIFVRHFEHLIDPEKMKIIILFRNPYYELAERLLVLKQVKQNESHFFGTRDAILYEDAAEFARELDVEDPKELRRGFRTMPDSVATVLSNPLVRCLSAQTQEETLFAGNVTAALDLLASSAAVGLRSEPDYFAELLSDKIEIGRSALPPIFEYEKVSSLGEVLCQISAVNDIIDRDLELYAYAIKAFEKAL